MTLKKGVGDGGSAAQKRTHGALPDTVRATKKSSTPVASGTTAEKGASDKDKATTNRNLPQGKESDAVCTVTSYFDPVWNSFSKHTVMIIIKHLKKLDYQRLDNQAQLSV